MFKVLALYKVNTSSIVITELVKQFSTLYASGSAYNSGNFGNNQ